MGKGHPRWRATLGCWATRDLTHLQEATGQPPNTSSLPRVQAPAVADDVNAHRVKPTLEREAGPQGIQVG